MSNENNHSEPLIRVSHLKQYFPINVGFFRTKPLKAVDDISFDIMEGETLGLVGESGCGKTTAGRSILHLYKPTAGEVIYRGKPVKTKADIEEFRRKATMVFQDPYSSLDPRMTVEDIVGEPLDVQKLYKTKEERRDRILICRTQLRARRPLCPRVFRRSETARRHCPLSGGQTGFHRM